MKPVKFKYANCVYAKDQDEYLNLPAWKSECEEGYVVTCWKMDLWERIVALFTGRVYVSILTYQELLQPQRVTIDCPLENQEKGK